jgi:hypothetical protein
MHAAVTNVTSRITVTDNGHATVTNVTSRITVTDNGHAAVTKVTSRMRGFTKIYNQHLLNGL